MECLRCQGLMIAIQTIDVGQSLVFGWRCLLSGAATDPIQKRCDQSSC